MVFACAHIVCWGRPERRKWSTACGVSDSSETASKCHIIMSHYGCTILPIMFPILSSFLLPPVPFLRVCEWCAGAHSERNRPTRRHSAHPRNSLLLSSPCADRSDGPTRSHDEPDERRNKQHTEGEPPTTSDRDERRRCNSDTRGPTRTRLVCGGLSRFASPCWRPRFGRPTAAWGCAHHLLLFGSDPISPPPSWREHDTYSYSRAWRRSSAASSWRRRLRRMRRQLSSRSARCCRSQVRPHDEDDGESDTGVQKRICMTTEKESAAAIHPETRHFAFLTAFSLLARWSSFPPCARFQAPSLAPATAPGWF